MTIKRLRRNGWILLDTVESNTKPDVEYEIKRNPATGTLGCACMGWAMNKRCSHLDAYIVARGIAVAVPHPTAPQKKTPDTVTVTVNAEVFTVRRAISFGSIG